MNIKIQKTKKIIKNIMNYIKIISKNFSIAIIAILIASAGVFSAQASLNTLESRARKLIKLNAEKQEIEKQICELTQDTAKYKMARHYDGDLELTQEDIDRILPKTTLECEEGL